MTLPQSMVASIHAAYKSGTLTSLELVDRCLARIESNDQAGCKLNAVVALNSRVRDYAQQLDEVLSRTRQLVGSLHGIPVVIKDNFHTVDMPTRGASAALSDRPSMMESTATRRLRDAGALMLAKTNMHELALSGTTVSSLAGQTLNPYDRTRTPGGSSGGTGVALAAGYGIVGLGTDTVNSIRSPASANGLVGLRPTRGLVSRAGVMPVAETQDAAGPMTLTVSDTARVLDVLAGFDAADPVTAHAAHMPRMSYLGALNGSTLNGARIGVMRTLFGDQDVNQDVNSVMEGAMTLMRNAGAHLLDIYDEHIDADRIIERFDVQKWEFREQFNAYLQRRAEPEVGTLTDLINTGRYHKPSLERFLQAANNVNDRWADKEYLFRLNAMSKLRDRVLFLMADHDVDVIIYPLQRCLVVPLPSMDQAQRNGIVAAVTGLPAINIPAGFSQPTAHAPMGVPVGMDMLGRPFREAHLLQLAYAFEQSARVYRSPPGITPLTELFAT